MHFALCIMVCFSFISATSRHIFIFDAVKLISYKYPGFDLLFCYLCKVICCKLLLCSIYKVPPEVGLVGGLHQMKTT